MKEINLEDPMEVLRFLNRRRWWTDIIVGYTVEDNDVSYAILPTNSLTKKAKHLKMIPLSVGP